MISIKHRLVVAVAHIGWRRIGRVRQTRDALYRNINHGTLGKLVHTIDAYAPHIVADPWEQPPLVYCIEVRSQFVLIECPFCGEQHAHGAGEGHRVSHCSPCTGNSGYILKLALGDMAGTLKRYDTGFCKTWGVDRDITKV